MAIKAIIFDCFGVLVLPGKQVIGNDYPDQAQELHDLSLQSDYGYMTRDEFNQQAAGLIGMSIDDFASKYWYKNVRNESAFEVVREFKASGEYKIGLLSNIGRNWLDDFIPLSEREQLFDTVILSGEVGMTKPSHEIFELTAERLGAQPDECIMVDDLLTNIDGAGRAGMPGVVYVSAEQMRSDIKRITRASRA